MAVVLVLLFDVDVVVLVVADVAAPAFFAAADNSKNTVAHANVISTIAIQENQAKKTTIKTEICYIPLR
jgi:hypothetical protein